MINGLLQIIESIKRATGDFFKAGLFFLAVVGFFNFMIFQFIFIMEFFKTGSLSLALETSLFAFSLFGIIACVAVVIFLNISVILLVFDYLDQRDLKRNAQYNPLPEQKNGQPLSRSDYYVDRRG